MKRPNKKPQKRLQNIDYIDSYTAYTPDDLREVAKKMEDEGVESIELSADEAYGSPFLSCEALKVETEQEAKTRYDKEYKQWKYWKKGKAERDKKEKEDLIKKAKKLGLTVKEK